MKIDNSMTNVSSILTQKTNLNSDESTSSNIVSSSEYSSETNIDPYTEISDSFEYLDESETASTDTGYKIDTETINKLKQEHTKQVEDFKNLISSMIKDQNNASNNFSMPSSVEDILNLAKDGNLVVSEEVQDAAKEAISEDGYWGVDKTAERILEMAEAFSGGDSSKLADLRDAVQDSFDYLASIFDDELPEISQKTYDKVMAGFDELENPISENLEESENFTDNDEI